MTICSPKPVSSKNLTIPISFRVLTHHSWRGNKFQNKYWLLTSLCDLLIKWAFHSLSDFIWQLQTVHIRCPRLLYVYLLVKDSKKMANSYMDVINRRPKKSRSPGRNSETKRTCTFDQPKGSGVSKRPPMELHHVFYCILRCLTLLPNIQQILCNDFQWKLIWPMAKKTCSVLFGAPITPLS